MSLLSHVVIGPLVCYDVVVVVVVVEQEMELPMLKVSAPELVSGVSGESEQKLRELFEQAVVGDSSSPSPLMRASVVSKGPRYKITPSHTQPSSRTTSSSNPAVTGLQH